MNWLQKIAKMFVEEVARRNIDDEFSREFLYQGNDDFLYHITSSNSIDSILADGLTSDNPSMFQSSVYPNYSRDKVFLTERSGLSFWDSRVESQLRDRHDNPPDIVIVRIPKTEVEERLNNDELGTNDSTELSYYIEDTTE